MNDVSGMQVLESLQDLLRVKFDNILFKWPVLRHQTCDRSAFINIYYIYGK